VAEPHFSSQLQGVFGNRLQNGIHANHRGHVPTQKPRRERFNLFLLTITRMVRR